MINMLGFEEYFLSLPKKVCATLKLQTCAETSLDVEKPEYDVTRSLLRSGPAASLRINIRAVCLLVLDFLWVSFLPLYSIPLKAIISVLGNYHILLGFG